MHTTRSGFAKRWLPVAPLAVTCLLLIGCGDGGAGGGTSSGPATSVDGAWNGAGTFTARAGSVDVKAQLELSTDGTYDYLILEPGILAMTGPEQGTWSHSGTSLTLTPGSPAKEEADADADEGDGEADASPPPVDGKSVFKTLRETSAPRPPRTLTVSADMNELTFDDGKLQITYTRR